MDETKLDSCASAWLLTRRSFEVYEDVVVSIPNFSTIERFVLVGGGKADDIYDRMMSLAYPKCATRYYKRYDVLLKSELVRYLAEVKYGDSF